MDLQVSAGVSGVRTGVAAQDVEREVSTLAYASTGKLVTSNTAVIEHEVTGPLW